MTRRWAEPAVPDSVRELRSAVCAFAGDQGVLNPPLEDLRLAVSEAVTNAVIHGYREDAAPGDVEVSLTVARDRIDVVVRDQGMGFKPRQDSPGAGMGMTLIAAVTEAFSIREARPRGTEVHMAFARS